MLKGRKVNGSRNPYKMGRFRINSVVKYCCVRPYGTVQQDLPKLPVPTLDHTLKRYLDALEPVCNPAQWTKLQSLVQDFAKNQGPVLQQALLERRDRTDNWAVEWWLNDMYLSNPDPLPLNSNPGNVWPPQNFKTVDDQLAFASKLIAFLMDYKGVLERGELPVEKCATKEPGQPMCMEQFDTLFTTCRIPGSPSDSVRRVKESTDHIIVAYKQHFFKVDVKSSKGRLSTTDIAKQLKWIVDNEDTVNYTPVGIFTSQVRPTWAGVRTSMMKDPVNKASLNEIETSNFIVCLDEPMFLQPGTIYQSPFTSSGKKVGHFVNSRDETNLLHQMLHGGGSEHNSANRWFDKTLQFIIGRDGAVGTCYEHASFEGVILLNLNDDFFKKFNNSGANWNEGSIISASEVAPPSKLNWTMNALMQTSFPKAQDNIDRLAREAELIVYRYTNYGKDFIKVAKCSPDVYCQLSLQLAFFRMNRYISATYESAGTRRYKFGRVDNIRSSTIETLNFVKAMTDPKSNKEERAQKFRAAVNKNDPIMTENILGNGIDIHMLGLKMQALDMGMPLPPLFADDTWRLANHFQLSTSQLPSISDQIMGYGAVCSDGYGTSYKIMNKSILFSLCSFRDEPKTSTQKFAENLQASLDSMQEALSK